MKNKLTSFACSALIFLPLGCISAQTGPTIKDCQAYGDTLVTNSGSALAEIGESPVDIRRTVDYYCMLGFRAASEAKSQNEIELWRTASMRGLSGINANRDQYKADVINHVAKIAEDFYKEKSVTDGAGK